MTNLRELVSVVFGAALILVGIYCAGAVVGLFALGFCSVAGCR